MSALRIIHITDLHLDDNDAVEILRDMMFRVQEEYCADAVFVTGDVLAHVPETWESLGAAYQNLWKDLGIPVFQCPGNHDVADVGGYDLTLYEKYCGPANYTTHFKGFCIVGFNVFCGHSKLRIRQRERDLKEYGCNRQWPDSASLTVREWDKIQKTAQSQPIILLQHTAPWQPEMIRAQTAGVRAIFSGHWHASKINRYKDCTSYNTPNPLFGGIDGSSAGCMIIDFKKDGSSKARFISRKNIVLKKPQLKRSEYKWSQSYGGTTERGSVLETAEHIFFTTWDRHGFAHNVTYALDPKNGQIVWKRRTEQAIKRSLIIVDDMIIGNGFGGTVYAMDMATGKVRWTAAVGNGVDRFLNNSPLCGSMADGRACIYSGNYHTFACFDACTGEQLWERTLVSEFAAFCNQPVYDASTHTLLLTQARKQVTAHIHGRDVTGGHAILNAENGEITHLHKAHVIECAGVTPCIDDGHIYSCDGEMCCSVYGRNKVLWRSNIVSETSGSITRCRYGLLLPSIDGTVKLIDPKNGLEVWSLQLGLTPAITILYSKVPHSSISEITERGAHLYFTAQDQHCYKVHCASGKIKARVALPAMSLCKPLIRAEGIFVTDYDGALHCLKMV